MTDGVGRPDSAAARGELAWLERRRRTTALQLEALSTRAARQHPARSVALRRRLRLLDAEIARCTP